MNYRTLENKPLVESILEIKWVAEPAYTTPPGSSTENVSLIHGIVDKFYSHFFAEAFKFLSSNGYPVYTKLEQGIPDDFSGHTVQHRFASPDGKWPMIQLGPGILTLNETDGYEWDAFRNRAIFLMKTLFNLHPSRNSIRITQLHLRYLNAIEFDYKNENLTRFISDNLKFEVNYDNGLFDNNSLNSRPIDFSSKSTFVTTKPKGFFTNSLNSGTFNSSEDKNIPSLIWMMSMLSKDEELIHMPQTFEEWIDGAHDIIDIWFRKSIEGNLQRRFS